MEAGCSWAVQYTDGSVYSRFAADGSENPWAAIDWCLVTRLAVASGDAEAEFDFQHPGEGYEVRLGSRKGMNALGGDGLEGVRMLILVTYVAGEPISDESVRGMFFWFPDGSYHSCDQYNCPDAQEYLHALVHGTPAPPLPLDHAQLPLGASAALAA